MSAMSLCHFVTVSGFADWYLWLIVSRSRFILCFTLGVRPVLWLKFLHRSSSPFDPIHRYIEASKTRLYASAGGSEEEGSEVKGQAQRVLVYAFDTVLRLLHPFMPFVTEQLWQVGACTVTQVTRKSQKSTVFNAGQCDSQSQRHSDSKSQGRRDRVTVRRYSVVEAL